MSLTSVLDEAHGTPPRSQRHPPRGSRTDARPLILVVDDDQNTRTAVQALLELDGYRVVSAPDGREALNLLEGGLRPALILLDLNMPRMDGVAFRAAQRCRRELATIPVIVCSGSREHEERMAALDPVLFLRKPMTVDQLQAAVHQHCPR